LLNSTRVEQLVILASSPRLPRGFQPVTLR
jgi:hypothetical protein